MTAGPEYTDITHVPLLRGCPDCGVPVFDETAHTRMHAIMSSWAWALAILKTHHASAEIHDQYGIIERIDSRRQ